MSWQDSTGQQLEPDDVTAPPLDLVDAADEETIVVHYGPTTTGSTTVGAAAARLGITLAEYRREFAALIACGYLIPRADGSYDAEVRA
jgi:hypothetical protein